MPDERTSNSRRNRSRSPPGRDEDSGGGSGDRRGDRHRDGTGYRGGRSGGRGDHGRGGGGRGGGRGYRGGGRDFRGGGGRQNDFQSDRMVYISNIAYSVRWMELKDLVREKGGDVSFVELLETPDGKSKGCAVVEFREKESADRCVENLHKHTMGDRDLVVKEIRDPVRFFQKVKEDTGIDFLGRGDRGMKDNAPGSGGGGHSSGGRIAPSTPQFETYGLNYQFLQQLGIDGPLTNRVFVANLPYTLNPARIKDIFCLAGKVTDLDLYLDKEGKSKGISVIEYSHPVEAVQAISMLNNQKCQDRGLVVKMDRMEKIQDRRPGEMPGGLQSLGMGLAGDGGPLLNISEILGNNGRGGGQLGSGTGGGGGGSAANAALANVGLGNAGGFGAGPSYMSGNNRDNNAVSSQMGNQSMVGNAGLVGMSGGAANLLAAAGPAGYGDNRAALSMNMSSAGNYGTRSDTLNDQRMGSGNNGGLFSMGSNDMYGSPPSGMKNERDDRGYRRSPELEQKAGWPFNSSNNMGGSQSGGGASQFAGRMILIRNMPREFRWGQLKDLAREAGEVEFAEISPPGVGKVAYKSSLEADRAIRTLHGYSLHGHTLMVDHA